MTSFKRNLKRDAILTDAAMRDARTGNSFYLPRAGQVLGLSPDEVLVEFPKWAAKWPRSYREQIAEELLRMDAKEETP